MISPPYLHKGSTIGIVSTARKISREEIQNAIDKIERWGMKVALGKNLFEEQDQFAGTAEQRAEDFQSMLDDESVDAILCARGGYGTVQMVDLLDFTKFMQKPKWVAGYSDVTTLHSHIHTNCGVQTLHSTMVSHFKAVHIPDPATDSLMLALTGEPLEYEFSAFNFNTIGKTEGVLCGGNLSILYSLLGSPSDIDTEGKILFMEDLDEYLYHVDRMMQNVKRNGKLDKVKGVLIGGMTDMNDNEIPFGKDAEEIVFDMVSNLGVPVAFRFPAGHIQPNMAIKLGCPTTFDVQETRVIVKQA